MATSDNSSIKSSNRPKTPGSEPGSRRVGFARPTLIIPPPQAPRGFVPQSASMVYTAGTIAPTPDMYGRKASMFVFDQFHGIKNFTMNTAKSGLGIGEKCSYWMYNKFRSWSRSWFTHWFLTIVLVLYTFCGAILFIYIEGHNEEKVVERDLRKDRYQLIRELRNLSLEMPQKTSEGEWEGEAARQLLAYEAKIIDAYQKHALLMSNPEGKIWTMWNAVVYCATIYTTIGYGHLYPTTTTGRALTIVYSIIGIPLFLIALTDFGKLFTRGIKFLWSFVRRLYYTGNCRQVRKTAHVREIFKGAQMMYDIATFRRPSHVDEEDPENPQLPPLGSSTITGDDTPTTPAISNFEIDDEFNLPISVALFILIAYIFIGALGYCAVEKWNFFASFYFVFISMSTIGFGDYVPRQPVCMILSIVYLCFGLALMSMCINVVQVKLSDTFKQASAKLGASIGFETTEETNSIVTVENLEIPAVHNQKSLQEKSEVEIANHLASPESDITPNSDAVSNKNVVPPNSPKSQ